MEGCIYDMTQRMRWSQSWGTGVGHQQQMLAREQEHEEHSQLMDPQLQKPRGKTEVAYLRTTKKVNLTTVWGNQENTMRGSETCRP